MREKVVRQYKGKVVIKFTPVYVCLLTTLDKKDH